MPDADPSVPVCTSAGDVGRLDGAIARVEGTYQEVDVRRKRTLPPWLAGHAAVVLADGTQVFLEPPWSPDAMRSADERQAWAGRLVAATGTLHRIVPPPPRPVATLREPCLTAVHRIEPA
jgi:hypothetical protein